VRGSVALEVAVELVVDVVVVVVELVWLGDVDVCEPLDWLSDELEVEEDVDGDCDEDECEWEELLCVEASGSVYCWSPAESASAIAGPHSATDTTITRLVSNARGLSMSRLLPDPAAASTGPYREALASRARCKSRKRRFCRIYCTTRVSGRDRDGDC
jgi:hypothetical protein